jgi:hypothetical protein
MKSVFLTFLLLSFAGSNSAAPASDPLVLNTPLHTVSIWWNCEEGEVGCGHLTGELLDKDTHKVTKLQGSTYMVKCADGVTPCHLGFYDLKGPATDIAAYPDGMLEMTIEGKRLATEQGKWLDEEP